MSNTGTINIALKIDDKGSVKVLQNVGRESKSTGEKGDKAFRDMDKSAGSFNKNAKITASTLMKIGAAVGGIAAVAKAYSMLKSAAEEYIALAGVQEAAERKLEAVLKATGGAAGYNIDQLKAMAGQMQQVTRYGDEVTLSAMAILATFKQVRGEGFERATKAAMDMATVMGTDLNSNILQIGKALNDPLKGITALNRAGVQFTDQQKDQIAALQASGRMMEAQNMILKELETQFGGAAEAMATDFTGRVIQAENALGDLKEELGFVITKNQVFIELAKLSKEYFERLTEQVKNNQEALMQNAKSGVVVLTYLIDTVVILSRNFELSGKIVAVMFASMNAAAWEAAGVLVAGPIKALEYIVELYNKIPKLPDISLPAGLTDFADTIIASAELANQTVIEGVKNIGDLLQRPLPGNAIRDAIENISGAADDAAGSAGGLGDTLEDTKPDMDAAAEAAWGLEAALKAIKYNEEAIQESWDDYITEMNRQIAREKAAYEKLQKDKANADEAAAEAMEKAHEKVTEEMERNYERLYDNIHDVNTELWRDLIDDGGNAFEIIKDKAKDVFAEIAATWSTQIMMNVITGGQGAAGMPFSGSSSSGGYVSGLTGLLNLPTTAGAYQSLTSGLLGNIGQGVFGAAWTGGASAISTGALAAGGELGWGAATLAELGTGTGMGGIAGGLAAAAPWAAMAAVAIPIVMGLLEDEPDPRIGLFAGTGTEGDLARSQDGYFYHTNVQDMSGEAGNAIVSYYDSVFSALDDITEQSINDIIANADYGDYARISWFDPSGMDTQAVIDKMMEDLFSALHEGLVSDIGADFDTDVFSESFFEGIRFDGETLLDTYARFRNVVEGADDFLGEFARQTEEYGLSAAQAYQNIETITVTIAEMDAAVSVITSSSALSSIAASVELWNAQIQVLEQANASLEVVTEAEEKRNLAIGAQITGLTVDSLANALKSGQGAGDVITEAINDLFRQQEAEDLFAELSPVIEEAGRIWNDTGGDIQAVSDYLEEAGYYLNDLEEDLQGVASSAEYLSDKADLSMQLLKAVGDDAAVLAMQREAEIEALEEAYGDAAGPLVDMVNAIYEIEEATRAAEERAQEFADAMDDIQDELSTWTSLQARYLDAAGIGSGLLDRQQEIADLYNQFGDAAGPLVDLVNSIYDLEQAAEEAALEQERLNALRDLEITLAKETGQEGKALAMEREDEINRYIELADSMGIAGSALQDFMDRVLEMADAAYTTEQLIGDIEYELEKRRLTALGDEEGLTALDREREISQYEGLGDDMFDFVQQSIMADIEMWEGLISANETAIEKTLADIEYVQGLIEQMESGAQDVLTSINEQIQEIEDEIFNLEKAENEASKAYYDAVNRMNFAEEDLITEQENRYIQDILKYLEENPEMDKEGGWTEAEIREHFNEWSDGFLGHFRDVGSGLGLELWDYSDELQAYIDDVSDLKTAWDVATDALAQIPGLEAEIRSLEAMKAEWENMDVSDLELELKDLTDYLAELETFDTDEALQAIADLQEELENLDPEDFPDFADLLEEVWELEDAAEAAAEAAALLNQKLSLENQLYTLTGDDAALQEVIAQQREIELEAMDESLRAIQERIWALQDEAAAEQEALDLLNSRLSLEQELYTLLGDDEALQAVVVQQRELELAAMDESLHAIQERIWALEDEAAAEQEALDLLNSRLSLEHELYTLTGDDAALQEVIAQQREIELEAMDESLHAIQERIWALEDEAAEIQQSEDALVSAYQSFQNVLSEQEKRFNEAQDAYVAKLQEELSEKEALRSETESTIDTFDDLRQSLSDFHMGILMDDGSPLGLDSRRMLAMDEFNRIAELARSGDAEAIADLTGAASTLLDITKITGIDYDDTFRLVQKELNAVNDIAEIELTETQQQLKALDEQIENQERLIDQIRGVEDKTLAELEAAYLLEKEQYELLLGQDQVFQDIFQTELSQYEAILDLVSYTESQIVAIEAVEAAITNLQSLGDSGGAGDSGAGDPIPVDNPDPENIIGPPPASGDELLFNAAQVVYISATGGVSSALFDAYNDQTMAAFGMPIYEAVGWAGDPAELKARYGFAEGGTISGPESGYSIPVEFHGTEHIVTDDRMGDVAAILEDVRSLLVSIRDIGGDVNRNGIRVHRILDRISQGQPYIMMKETS